MERIADKTIAALTPNGSNTLVLVPPPGLVRFAIDIVAKNVSGGANPTTVELKRYVGDGFYGSNPANTVTLANNEASTFTVEAPTAQVELVFTNGAQPPDGEVLVRLSGTRTLQ